jgi:hypothetical protein
MRGEDVTAARRRGIGGWRRGAAYGTAAAVVLLLVCGALAGCGSTSATPTHDLPGGVYTSTHYHFRVTYPTGWQLNLAPPQQTSEVSPLSLSITRSGVLVTNGSLVSTFSVTVSNAGYAPIATAVAKYPKDPTLHPITLSGLTAYRGTAVQQPIANTQFSDTHTDYYLIHGGYEYQLSTDAVQGDNAAAPLDAMLHSFTILP